MTIDNSQLTIDNIGEARSPIRKKNLLGSGNQYRYILVKSKNYFPKTYIKKLIKEAYANSLTKVKDPKQIMSGKTIVKSISPVKRTKKK